MKGVVLAGGLGSRFVSSDESNKQAFASRI